MFRTALLAASACLLFAGQAVAADRNLYFQASASGVCQAALPAFEGLIRKRPMAIQNEGDAPAFVTCSPTTLQTARTHALGHGIWLVNSTAAPAVINCTAVEGAYDGFASASVTRSVTVPANNHIRMYFQPADGFTATNEEARSFSCRLLPGTGVATVYTNHLLDVGT